MLLEKEYNNFKWYRQNQLKIKVKNSNNNSMLWVTLENYNICLVLEMYDILDKINEDILLKVKISKDQNNQRVFVVNSNEIEELILYVEYFVRKWNVKIIKNTVSESDFINKEVWYKTF